MQLSHVFLHLQPNPPVTAILKVGQCVVFGLTYLAGITMLSVELPTPSDGPSTSVDIPCVLAEKGGWFGGGHFIVLC